MANISEYTGISQFGASYRTMLENDTHAAQSVDRVLIENLVKLCSETWKYLYEAYTPTTCSYERGSKPVLERYLQDAMIEECAEEGLIEAIVQLTSSLSEKVSDDLDNMQVGGTEEEIIARGSDWCTDVARVGCALSQVAGFPARIVYLFNTVRAYSGHAIIEVYRAKVWGAVDAMTNVVYRHPGGKPASTWDLMNDHSLIRRHWRGTSTPYSSAEQFREAGLQTILCAVGANMTIP